MHPHKPGIEVLRLIISGADPSIAVSDPKKLLIWLGKDRAMVTFAGQDDVEAQASTLRDMARQCIQYV